MSRPRIVVDLMSDDDEDGQEPPLQRRRIVMPPLAVYAPPQVVDLIADDEEEEEVEEEEEEEDGGVAHAAPQFNVPIINIPNDWPDHDNVELKPSTILKPDGTPIGLGLFAKRNLKKKEYICAYVGVSVLTSIVHADTYIGDYAATVTPQWSIDSIDPNSCYGRYANDPVTRMANARFKATINAKYIEPNSGKGIDLVVMDEKPIRAGNEIFLNYGDFYWSDYHIRLLPHAAMLMLYRRNDNAALYVNTQPDLLSQISKKHRRFPIPRIHR
jgi:hypothetical protein